MSRSILTLLLVGLSAHLAYAQGDAKPPSAVLWQPSVEAATKLAKNTNRPIMWVVMMDGEIACKRMMRNVYTNAALIQKTADFVVVPCSLGDHTSVAREGDPQHGKCSIFPGVTCAEHRANEHHFRANLEARDEVISPQHVFTNPDGQLLWRKDYELKVATLGAEMDQALKIWFRLNPGIKKKKTGDEKPNSEQTDSSSSSESSESSSESSSENPSEEITEEEPDAPAAKMSSEEARLLGLLLDAPSKEKEECMKAFLAVAGRPAFAALVDALLDKQITKTGDLEMIIRTAGNSDYASGAEEFARLLKSKNKKIRHPAVVTLEEMSNPAVADALLTFYKAERDSKIKADILRAMGPAGAGNEKVRTLLLKEAGSRTRTLVQSATLGLGSHLAGNSDVREKLQDVYKKQSNDDIRKAVLYSYVIARDPSTGSDLEQLAEKERNKEMQNLVKLTQAVVEDKLDEWRAENAGGGGRGGRGGGGRGAWRQMMQAYRSLFEEPFEKDIYPRNRDGRQLMRDIGLRL